MNRNFERALNLVLIHEGGWADHPKDPGGATMKGVTLATFRQFVKPNGTKADLRNITDQQLATVYRKHYWDAVKADQLPNGLDYAVFDYAVNSGPTRAVKHLQAVLGLRQDGIIGPATLAAVNRQPAVDVIQALCAKRMTFLRSLKTWSTFGRGWERRVTGVRTEALAMAVAPDPNPAPQPVPASPVNDNKIAPAVSTGAKAAVAGFIAALAAAGAWIGDFFGGWF